MEDLRSFGRALRDLRVDAGLTQASVATSLDVSQGTVSNWERGEAWPDGYHMTKLAKMFGTSLERIVDMRFGFTTAVERAVVADKSLTRKEQDTLLAAYEVITGRNSRELVKGIR